jgi:thiol-disulfide isomerase/thioredoxin
VTLSRRTLIAALAPLGTAAAWAQPAVPPASSEAKAPPLPRVDTPLALARVNLFDGTVFEPARAEGQVLLVYWWASWCPFCAVQSPHIEKLWQTQRGRGLQVLALSVDRTREAAVNYMRQKNYSFPAGMLTPEVAKVLPKPKGLPVTVVRGRSGKTVFAEAGEMFPEDIEGLAKYL